MIASGLTIGAGGGSMVMIEKAINTQPGPKPTAEIVERVGIDVAGGLIAASGLGIAGIGGLMLTGIGIDRKKRTDK